MQTALTVYIKRQLWKEWRQILRQDVSGFRDWIVLRYVRRDFTYRTRSGIDDLDASCISYERIEPIPAIEGKVRNGTKIVKAAKPPPAWTETMDTTVSAVRHVNTAVRIKIDVKRTPLHVQLWRRA